MAKHPIDRMARFVVSKLTGIKAEILGKPIVVLLYIKHLSNVDVLLVQMDIEWMEPARNHRKVLELLEAHPFGEGSLILLPELFSTGFVTQKQSLESLDAEGIHQRDKRFLSELAIKRRSWVLAGSLGTHSAKFSNLALLFSPTGQEILRYRKIHPFAYGGETEHFSSGSVVATQALGKLHLQPAICYDLRFPELFRAGLAENVDFYTVIANWPAARQDHWETLLKARAIENQAWVAGVNRVGQGGRVLYAGGSRVYTPKGELMAEAGNGECVLPVHLEADQCRRWRSKFPVLQDRKPQDFYSLEQRERQA